MTHTINITTGGSRLDFDAVVGCQSRSGVNGDATTVVILKTSSLGSSSAELSLTKPTTSIVVLNNKCCNSSPHVRADVNCNWRLQQNVDSKVSAVGCANTSAKRDGDKRDASSSSSLVRIKTPSPSRGYFECKTDKTPVCSSGASVDAVCTGSVNATSIVAADANKTDQHGYSFTSMSTERPVNNVKSPSTLASDNNRSPGAGNCATRTGCDGGQVSENCKLQPMAGVTSLSVNSCNSEKSNACLDMAKEAPRETERLETDGKPNDCAADSAVTHQFQGHSDLHLSKSTIKKSPPAFSSRRKPKPVATGSNQSELKRAAASNPLAFTTSCAPDASSFQFLCQSCQMVRFTAYWDLRSHEDWCGRRNPSTVGMSCQKCGFRYKNLVLLHRHAVEVHGSDNKDEIASPDMQRSPAGSNPYSFTTVGAPDEVDFPYVCARCSTVCFRSYADARRHEDWCGRSAQNGGFVCGTCNWGFHDDVLLKRHVRDCAGGLPSEAGVEDREAANDDGSRCDGTKDRCDVSVAPIRNPKKRAATQRESVVRGPGNDVHEKGVRDPIPSRKQSVKRSPCDGPFCCTRCDTPLDSRSELARHKRHCNRTGSESPGVASCASQISLGRPNPKDCRVTNIVKKKKPVSVQIAKKLNERGVGKTSVASPSGFIRCWDCGEQLKTRLLLMRHKRNGTCRKLPNMCDSSNKVKYSNKMHKVAVDGLALAYCHGKRGKQSRVTAKQRGCDDVKFSGTEQVLAENGKILAGSKKSSCRRVTKDSKILPRCVSAEEVKVQSCTDDEIVMKFELPAENVPLSVAATDVRWTENDGVTGNDVSSACCSRTVESSNTNQSDECNDWRRKDLSERVVHSAEMEAHVTDDDGRRKTHEADRSAVENAGKIEAESEAATDVKRVGVGSVCDVQQTSLLRALDLIPVASCVRESSATVGDQTNAPADGLRRSCRRKRKRIWTSTSFIDLLKPLYQAGANAHVDKGSTKVDDEVSGQRQIGNGKSGLVKVKKTEEVRKKSAKVKNVTMSSRNQQKKSSLRTLETVNENTLKCVVCGLLLRTVRQIIAHVCRS